MVTFRIKNTKNPIQEKETISQKTFSLTTIRV